MRSSLDARNAASSVRGYYRGKTAAIINRYGPGPRVHYHLGLFGKSRPAPRATAEQLRAQIVVAQERLLERAGAAWSADSAFAGNLLDLGCGLGGGAIYWAQHFPVEVTAVTNVVEHAEVVRDLAAAAGVADRVHPLVADAARLPSSEHYAAAVAVESSCCMPRSLLFQRVAALLVPGGVFGIDDAFLADLTWRAAFDDYWTARIGTLPEYRQAAAQAGLVLEQDLDVTAETSEFWRFSIAWARAKMAEPALSPADRTRLARSVSWHRLFLRGWHEGAYQHHFLRFRKQRQGRRRAAGTRLLVRQYWHSGQRPGVRAQCGVRPRRWGGATVDTDGVRPRGVNADVPNVARIYDYLLGGKDNFAADRIAAAKTAEIEPEVARRVRENRDFLGRAVRFLAAAGIRQFIDVGTGLPTQENVHQVARRLIPDARVAYVDNDPVVVVHAKALLATDPGTMAIEADMREPAEILRQVTEQGFIDLAQPVAVIMLAVLHFIPGDSEVTRIVATFRDRMAAGSYLVITHAAPGNMTEDDRAQTARIYAASSAGSITLRSYDQITALFDGLELEEPGIVPAARWRPASYDSELPDADVIQLPLRRSGQARPPGAGPAFVGGLARKPSC